MKVAKKMLMESLSLQVPRRLKQALRKQARRAGLSLSEWVRTRLELEGTDPDELRAVLLALNKLRERVQQGDAESKARAAEFAARERERPAREAAIRAEAKRWARENIAGRWLFDGNMNR